MNTFYRVMDKTIMGGGKAIKDAPDINQTRTYLPDKSLTMVWSPRGVIRLSRIRQCL